MDFSADLGQAGFLFGQLRSKVDHTLQGGGGSLLLRNQLPGLLAGGP